MFLNCATNEMVAVRILARYFACIFNLCLVVNFVTEAFLIEGPSQGERIHIVGVTGEVLELPCSIKIPPKDRVSLILWYKDNQSDAIFTYDARGGPEGHHQTGQLGRRASFSLGKQVLYIEKASLSDSGEYECRVDFASKPSLTTLLKVSIADAPSSIAIKKTNGKLIPFTIQSTVGRDLILDCVVSGGIPKPRVWWTLNNMVVDDTKEDESEHEVLNRLTLATVTRDLHQSRLSCHASNNNVTKPLHSDITILLNLPPTKVQISGLSNKLHDGRSYRALCEVEGSRPSPIVTWKIGRQGQEPITVQTKDLGPRNHSKSWFEFKVNSSLNKAQLSCEAKSPRVPNVVATDSTMLRVIFAPRLSLSLGAPLKAEDIREGVDVYFECSILANPNVTTVKWYRNGKEVLHNPSARVIISHHNLVLQKIMRKWTGEFSCKASNELGAGSSSPLKIVVQYAPVCVQGGTTLRVSIGQEAKVPCRVKANPFNVTFSWTFTNSVTQENLSLENVSWRGMDSILIYKPENSEHYGTLQCWAKNNIGKQRVPCKINIKPAGSPSAPVNCTVSNQTWESFEVTCGGHQEGEWEKLEYSKVEDGGKEHISKFTIDSDEPKYLLTVRESISKALIYNVTGSKKVFPVRGLTPGLDYLITICRYNSHGRSPEVTLEALTHRTAENRMREEEEIESNQAILGGVVGAVGLFIIIGVIILLTALRGRSRSCRLEDTALRPQNQAEKDYRIEAVPQLGQMSAQSDATRLLEDESLAESCQLVPHIQDVKREDASPDILGVKAVKQMEEVMPSLRPSGYAPVSKIPPNESREYEIQNVLRNKCFSASPQLSSLDMSSPTASCSSSPLVLSPSQCRKPHSVATSIQSPVSAPQDEVPQGKHMYVRIENQKYKERESFL